MLWSENIIQFYNQLQAPPGLPAGVEVLLPFAEQEVSAVFSAFYKKYYSDNLGRHAIIGINPGRFGGGVTGIPFTDPIRLANDCAIHNSFAKKQELSSVFIYAMIKAFGGPENFYRQFYVTAYSPLGFIKQGKNLNYYDDKNLAASVEPFAAACMRQQMEWGIRTDLAFCLGEGKNFAFLSKLNGKHGFFETIVPLPHPRFIMQYKLRQQPDYIQKYLDAFDRR